ncbi:MAG: hypothetical protein WBA45_03455 [Microthrixaceae bacterium]
MSRAGAGRKSDRSTDQKSDRGKKAERPPTAAEARAEFEAEREANKAARRAEIAAAFPEGIPGVWVAVASWVTTALFIIVSVPAVIDPDKFIAPYFAVTMALFLVGCALFAADIFLMASRSRDDLMGIGGIFLLVGSVPRKMQVHLLSALVIQIVVSVVSAAVHPFTPLAFGTLVPILGLSLCGLWSVLHGHFPAQIPDGAK